MLIPPRPMPPYWPAYPEPERSRLEASYRALDAEWQREAMTAATLNLVLALSWPLAIVAAVVIWVV